MSGAAAAGMFAGEIASSGMQAYFNAQQSQKARKFAKRMYKKRYQYTMEDMRKAGLNPILAAGGGMAGNAPGAVPARIDKPQLGQAASAYVAMQQQKAQARLLSANARKAEAEADAIEKSGLGVTTPIGRKLHSVGDAVIDVFDLLTGERTQKGGTVESSAWRNWMRGRGYRRSWRQSLPPPDRGRSGYDQSYPRTKIRR